jgi:hypothetical protein
LPHLEHRTHQSPLRQAHALYEQFREAGALILELELLD